jgi:hypothetical protein
LCVALELLGLLLRALRVALELLGLPLHVALEI